ncbi:MAG: gamma-glutamyl-phosphate reductase, partial [Desulfobacterales bacterium]|nr:gamma-glutamyl-phosphate reductase [Desulfobacterales bacterium]
MSVESTIVEMSKAARAASIEMARCPSDKKNEALIRIADNIEKEA